MSTVGKHETSGGRALSRVARGLQLLRGLRPSRRVETVERLRSRRQRLKLALALGTPLVIVAVLMLVVRDDRRDAPELGASASVVAAAGAPARPEAPALEPLATRVPPPATAGARAPVGALAAPPAATPPPELGAPAVAAGAPPAAIVPGAPSPADVEHAAPPAVIVPVAAPGAATAAPPPAPRLAVAARADVPTKPATETSGARFDVGAARPAVIVPVPAPGGGARSGAALEVARAPLAQAGVGAARDGARAPVAASGGGGRGGAVAEVARAPAADPGVGAAREVVPAPAADSGGVSRRTPDGGVPRAPFKLAATSSDGERRSGWSDDLVLVPRFAPDGGATLAGRVLEVDSGRPLAGVLVEARHGQRYMRETTDAGGAFRMPGMLPGTRVVVWIGSRRDPFVAERIDVTIPAEGQVADVGSVKLLRGDEMGLDLDGWVGLFLGRRGGRVTVNAVSPWLAGERAGIKIGDVIVSIDGRNLAGLGAGAAAFLLRGPVGSATTLVVEDFSATRRTIVLQRVAR
jgi:hypothetical protein